MPQPNFYRCYNCQTPEGMPGVQFVAYPDKPVCPNCGADKKSPITGRFVELLSVIHYEPSLGEVKEFEQIKGSVRGTVGCGYIACDPKVKVAQTNTHIYSGEPSVVNCPACRQTDAFKSAESTATINPRFDIPMHLTAGGWQFTQGPDNPAGLVLPEPMREVIAEGHDLPTE